MSDDKKVILETETHIDAARIGIEVFEHDETNPWRSVCFEVYPSSDGTFCSKIEFWTVQSHEIESLIRELTIVKNKLKALEKRDEKIERIRNGK